MKLQSFIKEIVIISIVLISQGSVGQVPYERILNASDEPQNWLTYNGGYMSQRYSLLDQINRENVNQLSLNGCCKIRFLVRGNQIPLLSMASCM